MRDGNETIKCMNLSRDIIDYIRGTTGDNFQDNIYQILKVYYKYNKKTYDMPQAIRGDFKNDGWVAEDKLFYCLFAPYSIKDSIYRDMQKKLDSDLKGLCENVYEHDMWGKEIKKVYYLVNIADRRSPADPTFEFKKIADNYKKQYSIDFIFEKIDIDFIGNMIQGLPSDQLEVIKFKLRITSNIDLNEPNASQILDTISKIAKNCGEHYISGIPIDYTRISTPRKVVINSLLDVNDEIETIISKLGIVEKTVSEASQDILAYQQFEDTKNHIIGLYNSEKASFSGTDLYHQIINSILDIFDNSNAYINSVKFLIVYIFDKCDIFEKEEKVK